MSRLLTRATTAPHFQHDTCQIIDGDDDDDDEGAYYTSASAKTTASISASAGSLELTFTPVDDPGSRPATTAVAPAGTAPPTATYGVSSFEHNDNSFEQNEPRAGFPAPA